MHVNCMDSMLKRLFYKCGYFVGGHPGYFTISIVLLSMLCISGFQKINNNIDPEYLFSPINGPGKYERRVVEEHFKLNYSHGFNLGRITRAGRFGRVIVTSKTEDKNILRVDVWKELVLLDGLIRNLTVFYEDEYFTYNDVCARWGSLCFTNDILNLDTIIDKVEENQLKLFFPVMLNPKTLDIHVFPVYFGGTERDEDNFITSVPSLQLGYFLNVDTKKWDAKGAAWEDAFLDFLGEAEEKGTFKHIKVARFSSRTLDHELEKNTRTVIPYFWSAFIVMAVFSMITCMMRDWVRSKPWLGLLGNISAALATASAFGTCMYFGVDFIGLNLAAPFLMIGTGIDDTFVMLSAWRRTSLKDDVPHRMAQMLSEAAGSITLSSLTNMVGFLIGVFNPFPSVQIFCIYIGIATLFTFIWHITFFASCLAISGYCEQNNRHSLICMKVQPVSKSGKRSVFYRIFCSGGVNPDDPNNPIDNKEHGLMVFFRDYLAAFLNLKIVKMAVILCYMIFLLFACYGITQVEEGLERRKVAKSDSYAVEFFDREDDFFKEFPYRIQIIVSGEYNYSDPIIQQQVENLTQTFENTSYILGSLYTESWLRIFLQSNEDDENTEIDTEEKFIAELKKNFLHPLSSFSLDVKFNDDKTKITAMRFMVQAVNISGTNHEKEMVQAIRQICADSPLNASVFNPYFVFFDQFALVKPTCIQNMVVGAIVMMIISFLFIPDPLCSLWVAFSIVSIGIGVVGYMALWKVNLDSISMINLIMCGGFSIDYTGHICYAYSSSKAKNTNDRVKDCLYASGQPILQGAVSTILGIVALLLPNNYLFTVFFKMVFLVVSFGALHGLILLPVLLSLFGPNSCKRYNDDDDIKLSSVEKDLPPPYCIPHPQFTLNGGNRSLKNSIAHINKAYIDVDKDLGLGTSEESSESSSNKSNKRNALDDDAGGWKRRSSLDITQNRDVPPRVLDIFGTETESQWQKQKEQENRRFSDNCEKYKRKYIPTEQKTSRRPLSRSSSHHNMQHPRFVKELRFP